MVVHALGRWISEFQGSQGYVEKHCLQKKQQKQTNETPIETLYM